SKEDSARIIESIAVFKYRYDDYLELTATIVSDDYCVLKELKSPRRGLEVQGTNGSYSVNSRGDWKATMRTIRDAILSCSLKLVKETSDIREGMMEFSNA
ncbi:hypothetical protein AAVH_23163, partial [Aphelenchoides avenae]